MIYKTLLLLFSFLIITSCSQLKKEQKIVKELNVNTEKNLEFVAYFYEKSDTIKFNRNIKIIENTLNDTIIFGHSLLAPEFLGQIEYTKFKNKNDITLDLRYANPPADRICISKYKEKKARGILKIELIIENNKR